MSERVERETAAGPSGGSGATATTDVHADRVDTQNVAQTINQFFGAHTSAPERTLDGFADALPARLPPGLHAFRESRHAEFVGELERQRVLILVSYQQIAAYASAHAVLHDGHFHDRARRSLSPAASRLTARSDFDIVSLIEELSPEPQIILVDIGRSCVFLRSLLTLAHGDATKIHDRLDDQRSYLVLAVDEDVLSRELASDDTRELFPRHSVSHLDYLVRSPAIVDGPGDLEGRLRVLERQGTAAARKDLYLRVQEQLRVDPNGLRALVEREEAVAAAPGGHRARIPSIRPEDIISGTAPAKRAVAFVATYLPDLSRREFGRLVTLLLEEPAAATAATATTAATTATTATTEPPILRWPQDADQILGECHLRPVRTREGFLTIDIADPSLRGELRNVFDERFPWYVLRQVERLQTSGLLFSSELSETAAESLAQFLVDQAALDPDAAGVSWLVDLVLALEMPGPGAGRVPVEQFGEFLERLVAEAQVRRSFCHRLAILIRQMLDREHLRPLVAAFFTFMIAARKHGALLEVTLELARLLRFAPHFEPLGWLRILLDQGSADVQRQTEQRLVALAARSGPRLYQTLAIIRGWLPDTGRRPEQFSRSNRFALDFPFSLSIHLARASSWSDNARWPPRYPLFFALPDDPAAAGDEIGRLLDWCLDMRGVAASNARPDEQRAGRSARVQNLADAIEHWAWILEGDGTSGNRAGAAMFDRILRQLASRTRRHEQMWLLERWEARVDRCLERIRQTADDDIDRAFAVRQRAMLDRVRQRFAAICRETPPPAA